MKQKDHHNRANQIVKTKKIKRLIAIGLVIAMAIGLGAAVFII